MPTSFVPTNPYPQSIYSTSVISDTAGGVLVTIRVTPIQINTETNVVTLYDDLVFDISYTAPTPPTPVQVTSSSTGNTIYQMGDDIDVHASLSASSSTNVEFIVSLTDNSGTLLHRHSELLNVPGGTSVVSYDIPTTNLPAGAKYVEISFIEPSTGNSIHANTIQVTLAGISLNAALSKGTYTLDETTAELTVEVRDENGRLVTGIASNFTVEIDGSPVVATFNEVDIGVYAADIPISGLSVGSHTLLVSVQDSRGITASGTLSFAVASPDIIQVTTDLADDWRPAIARTDDGKLWVVWDSWRSDNNIWYKTSDDNGATWSADTQLTTDPGSDYDPAIMQASDGTIWVAWYSWRSGNADIWYKTSTDGGVTWSDAVQLTTDPNSDYGPAITQTSDGTIWIVWYSYRSGNADLWCKTSIDGGASWSAEAQIDGNCCHYRPSLTVAGDGVMWLASERNDDIWYQFSSDNGATWSAPQQWTRFVGYDDYPNLAALSGNRVGLVWQSNRSGNDDVWFGIFGEREDVNPPPYISSIEHTPSPNPGSNDVVTFRAYAQDESAVASVHLLWEQDGLPQPDAAMYDDGAHDDYNAADGWYGVQMGPFPVGTEIAYQVRAADSDGNTVTWPMTPKSFTVLETFTKTADILFVPDYGSNSTDWFRPYYTNALDTLGYAYDVWDTGLRGAPNSDTLNLYTDGAVIWAVPYWGYFDDWDVRPDIEAYLDAGGKLFMTGQNVAEYLNGTTLLNDYLHATYVQDDTDLYALNGVTGDPIGDGLTLGISGGDGANNQYDTDEIDPIGPAVTVFTYDTGATTALLGIEAEPEANLSGVISSGTAGLRVDTGIYKVVYFAFGFEGINSASDRATVMGRVLAWLQELVPPVASFTSSSPDWLGQETAFTNTTVVTGPVSHLWDFGDGVTSTLESPIHTYTNPGVYTVVLTATNFVGSDVATGTVTVHGPPDAAFTTSSPDWLGQATIFTNTTTGQEPITCTWDFGDGVTSTQESPTHIYGIPGIYTVALTVINPAGSDIATDTVTIHGPPEAGFTTSSPDWQGQITFFTNTTTGQGPIIYTWDFGDGITSTMESPTHTYASSGVRTVVLTAANPAGSNVATDTVILYSLPTAGFTAYPTEGFRPLTVAFTDTTTTTPPGDPTLIYLWHFGDGQTSTVSSPTHTYTTRGAYTVTLTARNAAGEGTVTRTNYITVYEPVQAAFTASPTSGVAPLTVVFTNTSTGDYTASLWDFGDGVTSTLESPTHTYTLAGAFTVSLTVSGPGGSDAEVKANYITVSSAWRVYLPLILRSHP